LRLNRPKWNVIQGDVRAFGPERHLVGQRIDLLAGGVPCPPFSVAGRQLGSDDERDLFPAMLDLAEQIDPSALMIENVRGLLQDRFSGYRAEILQRLKEIGFVPVMWQVLKASEFGVPQLRPRSVLVALKPEYAAHFTPPAPRPGTVTVAAALAESMKARGLEGADFETWAAKADCVAPTLVGGSKKHGGADLGPTRARAQWERMGIDGRSVAEDGEPATLEGPAGRGPRLTVSQAALIQGFPAGWEFAGRKTARYRAIGNAFPPPVAHAVAERIREALEAVGGAS
jgi:DNA (cytosine-5)-methyltransferase 1